MASLTDRLSGQTNPAGSVRNPGPEGPSTLGALAEFATGLVRSAPNMPTREERAASAFSEQQASIEDDLATFFIQGEAAVDQGVMNRGEFRDRYMLRVEEAIEANPDHANEILGWVDTRGRGNSLLTNLQENQTAREFAQEQQRESAQWAMTNIPSIAERPEEYSEAQRAQAANVARAREHTHEVARAADADARAANAEARADAEYRRQAAQRIAETASLETLHTVTAPILESFFSAYRDAATPEARAELVLQAPEYIAAIRLAANEEIASLSRAGAPQSSIDRVQSTVDSRIQVFELLGSDVETQTGALSSALSVFEDSASYDLYTTVPGLVEIAALGGDTAFASLTNTLAIETRSDINAYLTGDRVSPAGRRGGEVVTSLTRPVMEANREIVEEIGIDPWVQRMNATGTMMTDNPEYASDFAEQYISVIAYADQNFVPGQVKADDMIGLSETTFNAESARHLARLHEIDSDEYDRDIRVARNVAMDLFQMGQDTGLESLFLNDQWSVEFDETSGEFVSRSNFEQQSAVMARLRSPASGVSSYVLNNPRQSEPAQVRNYVEAMNDILGFLTSTHRLDDDLAQNLSRRALRVAYYRGELQERAEQE